MSDDQNQLPDETEQVPTMGAGYVNPSGNPGELETAEFQTEGAEAPIDEFDPWANGGDGLGDFGTQAAERAIVLDVSQFQPHPFPFAQLRDEGVRGVYVRLTFGDRADSLMDQHIQRAKEAGLLVGGYHFLDGRKDIEPQFQAFQQALSRWQLELPPVVDVEEVPSISIPLPQAWQVRTFVERLRTIRPHIMIYTSKRYYDRVGNDSFGCDLWIAHWEVSPGSLVAPTLPDAWQNSGW